MEGDGGFLLVASSWATSALLSYSSRAPNGAGIDNSTVKPKSLRSCVWKSFEVMSRGHTVRSIRKIAVMRRSRSVLAHNLTWSRVFQRRQYLVEIYQ